MKDHLHALVEEILRTQDSLAGRNLCREYLQARTLEGLQRLGLMVHLAFQGGTALRFLFRIPRYSEDLDFTLERPPDDFDLDGHMESLGRHLRAQGYPVEARTRTERTVVSAMLRFPGLLYELGLSHRREQVFSIKIEVDTRPPAGAGLDTTVVRRHLILRLHHHDRASLLAGKLHAVLQRPWTKGRDLFDLLWYLSEPEWPAPNLVLLNNALAQSHYEGGPLTGDSWRGAVAEKIASVDFQRAAADVEPFLEPHQGTDMLDRETLLGLLLS